MRKEIEVLKYQTKNLANFLKFPLGCVIAVAEMFTIAKQIAAKQASVSALMVAGLFYFIFNYVVAFAMEALEKKLSYYR